MCFRKQELRQELKRNGDRSTMEALYIAVDEWVAIITSVIAIYFFVSLVVNLAQAQLSTATGDVIGHAHALQQAIAMVILLAVAASSKALIPALQFYISPETAPQTGAGAFDVWAGLARLVVSVVIGGTVIITTLSVVYSGLDAQINQTLGASSSMSHSMVRLIMIVSGGILTIASMGLANWLLSLIL